MKWLGVLFICLFLPVAAVAKYVAVLETVCNDSVTMPLQERQYVTNVLRAEAVKALPVDSGFTIMTRENIVTMLPPGVSIEECEGSCLVETGRNIAADYVAQARVGVYADKYTLTVELYETSSSKLVSSFTGRGSDDDELLKIVEERAPDFFRVCKPENGEVVPEPDTVNVKIAPVYTFEKDSAAMAGASDDTKSIPTNIKTEHPWDDARPTLIWVSASVLVVGVVGALFADYYAQDAYDQIPDNVYQYRDNRNNMQLAQNLRTVGIIMGIVGAAGLGFSIFF